MTIWTVRAEVVTDRDGRKRPVFYICPLEGVNGVVHDEDDEVILIYADTGKEIPATKWTPRPILDDL